MKKTYISPDFLTVALKTRAKLLNASYNGSQQAASNADVFARDLDIDEDDF